MHLRLDAGREGQHEGPHMSVTNVGAASAPQAASPPAQNTAPSGTDNTAADLRANPPPPQSAAAPGTGQKVDIIA